MSTFPNIHSISTCYHQASIGRPLIIFIVVLTLSVLTSVQAITLALSRIVPVFSDTLNSYDSWKAAIQSDSSRLNATTTNGTLELSMAADPQDAPGLGQRTNSLSFSGSMPISVYRTISKEKSDATTIRPGV